MADFKINYKGTNCRGINYIYKCPGCQWEQDENHAAAATPEVTCGSCHGITVKKPMAPAFDADHHESMMSHNLGWPTDESK